MNHAHSYNPNKWIYKTTIQSVVFHRSSKKNFFKASVIWTKSLLVKNELWAILQSGSSLVLTKTCFFVCPLKKRHLKKVQKCLKADGHLLRHLITIFRCRSQPKQVTNSLDLTKIWLNLKNKCLFWKENKFLSKNCSVIWLLPTTKILLNHFEHSNFQRKSRSHKIHLKHTIDKSGFKGRAVLWQNFC